MDTNAENQAYTAPAIVMGIIFIIIIAASVVPNYKINDAITAVATLIAAFVGAKAAFHMQDEKKKNEEIESQCSAINHVLYQLFDMWNTLALYKRDVIVPATSQKSIPWLSMTGVFSSNYEIELSEKIQFLLNSYADNRYYNHPNLYSKIKIEEKSYNLSIRMINYLHTVIATKLAPELEKHNYHAGIQIIDVNVLYNQLGPVLFHEVDTMTNNVFKIVDENIESIKKIFCEFRSEMTLRFPGIKFIDVPFP